MSGTGTEKLPNLPNPKVGDRYRKRTEHPEVSATGIEVLPKKHRYPRNFGREHTGTRIIFWYRSHRSVGYRYRVRSELTEVSVTGIEFEPNTPVWFSWVFTENTLTIYFGTCATEHALAQIPLMHVFFLLFRGSACGSARSMPLHVVACCGKAQGLRSAAGRVTASSAGIAVGVAMASHGKLRGNGHGKLHGKTRG